MAQFKNFVFRTFLIICFPISLVALMVVTAIWIWVTTPNPEAMRKCLTTKMFKVELCPGSGKYARLKDISTDAIQAIVAAEDSGFYGHDGFDWYELKASFARNMTEKSFKRGGSTITQQLAKNVFLNKDKTIMRKLREALLTYKIEKSFSKNEILERYLNVIELGPGIYGVKAAAAHYFNKSPANLHLLESAFLAYLLPNPKKYSAVARSQNLTAYTKKKMKIVCQRLLHFGKISAQAYTLATEQIENYPWSHLSQADFNAPVEGSENSDLNLNDSLDTNDLEEPEDNSGPEMPTEPPPPAAAPKLNSDGTVPPESIEESDGADSL